MDKKKVNISDLLKEVTVLQKENKALREKLELQKSLSNFDSPYKSLAEKSKDGVLIVQDNKIKYLNTGFMEMLGYTREEVFEQTYEKFVPNEEWLKLQDNTRRRLMGEDVPSVYETMIYNKAGHLLDIEINVTIVYYENKPAVIAAIRDISNLNSISKELERKTIFLESILRKLPLLLFSINKDGIFTLSEGEALKDLGLKAGEAVGKSYKELYDSDPRILESISRALKGEQHMDQGYFNDHYFETHYTPLYNANKEIEGIVGVGLDITKRKKAQEEIQKYVLELSESKEKLEEYSLELNEKNKILQDSEKSLIELNTNKDKFFSIVSHDLRSPFTSLIGLSDFLLSNFDELEPGEIKESIDSFNRNSKNIYTLLENLLAWAKIQMGRQEIELKEVNLNDVILHVLGIFQISLKNKNLTVVKDVDERINLFVDANMLHTAIRNILSNSIKFTPDKGELKIITNCTKGVCELLIVDSGIGMDEDQIQGLFNIDGIKSTPGLKGEKGSGLGLILSKELIEANGGRIRVESEVGKGTTFKLIFPVLKIS